MMLLYSPSFAAPAPFSSSTCSIDAPFIELSGFLISWAMPAASSFSTASFSSVSARMSYALRCLNMPRARNMKATEAPKGPRG